ncbi:MAG TPA: hypothetical protein VGS21_04505 [Acidimicrobiales bacterium]|nr:hypothetical protein [Acidimicrobiales bacterium]
MVAGLCVLLAAAGFASAEIKPAPLAGGASLVSAGAGLPFVSPPGTLSSAWYCPGPLPVDIGGSQSEIDVVDTAPTPVSGTVSLALSTGASIQHAFTAPAGGRVSVSLAGLAATSLPLIGASGTLTPQWAAAQVDVSGGGVAVTEAVQTSASTGSAVSDTLAPCQVSTSTTWYFPSGSTAAGSDLLLSLYNPSATSAVANVSFVPGTPPGSAPKSGPSPIEPVGLQGLTVANGQTVVIDVGHDVQLEAQLATDVTAVHGRLVAGEWAQPVYGLTASGPGSQAIGKSKGGKRPAYPAPGAFVGGASSPLSSWVFPPGPVPGPGLDAYWIMNPSPSPAVVTLTSAVDASDTTTLSATIAPGSLSVVVPPNPVSPREGPVSGALSPTAAPPLGGYVEVTAAHGVGVVVSRSSTTTVVTTSHSGKRTSTLVSSPVAAIGVAVGGRSFVLAGFDAPGPQQEQNALEVANPGTRAVVVGLGLLQSGSIEHYGTVSVPAGGVVSIDLLGSGIVATTPLEVFASGPALVERDFYLAGGKAATPTVGIPVA